MKIKLAIIFALILIATLISTTQPHVSAQRELSAAEQEILTLVARRESVDATQLKVLNYTKIVLPLTGRNVQIAKVLNEDGDRLLSAAVDEQGKEVDFETLKADETRAYRERFGKLEPKLHQRLQGLSAGDKVSVAFWLNPAEDLDAKELRDGRTELTLNEADDLLARRAEQVKAASVRATEGLQRSLQSAGYTIDGSSEGAPIVFATLPASFISQFAERPEVQMAYLADGKGYQDHMNIAAPSIKADQLWSLGVTGVGARIAIVEDSRVDFTNSCLPNNLGTRIPNDPEVDDHATACAGMAAGTSNKYRGVAPDAGIYSSNSRNYFPNNVSAALDAAAWNAHVLNNSWGMGCGDNGAMDIHARHADYIVRYIWDTVTTSAGNNGLCPNTEFVTTIGTGYNVIAVGNYDDNNTVKSSDNIMNPTSSFKDPPSLHGDREKPEVAAPGTNIRSTIMTPVSDCVTDEVGSGTSYSAPIVAGLAADLIQARPGLAVYPESMKALILAGAIDNVEGAARLSEYDGAGGVNALASYTSAVNNRYQWNYLYPALFDANGFYTINMGWVNAGQRVKVALVWDSNPTADYVNDPLNADLDLNVVGPVNSEWSASWDNSYEVVDFTAAASGYFQIKVKNYRFNGASEYVAVAWSL